MSLTKEDFEYIHFESIDSTNNYAKTLTKLGLTNRVIIADTQTAGRTTKKQGWISPKGNLYFSIVLPLTDERNLSKYSFLSALSIAQSVKQIDTKGNNTKIKWPNDILLNTQKLCGILIEKEDKNVIIGIGVNIKSSPDSSLTRYPTTNLLANEITTTPNDLSHLILENLISNINLYREKGFEEILSLITPYMYKFGETIYLETPKKTISGKFEGLNPDGAIILNTGNETQIIISGEMTKENFI